MAQLSSAVSGWTGMPVRRSMNIAQPVRSRRNALRDLNNRNRLAGKNSRISLCRTRGRLILRVSAESSAAAGSASVRDLHEGLSGPDVRSLQELLYSRGVLSSNNRTGYVQVYL